MLVSYAQNREDLLLYVLLHTIDKGFYVDVGANYPELDSVTKFFYDRGWSGVNIEPVNSLYKMLQHSRRRDTNVNMGVSNKSGSLTLREYTDGYHGWSTFNQDLKSKHGSKPHVDYEVPVKPLGEILDDCNVSEIDFMKVDVEGYEYEVLTSNNWDKYRPKVIVIEGREQKCIDLLKKNQYEQVFYDGLNTYFVRSDMREQLTMDDYVEVLLSGEALTTPKEQALVKQLKTTEKVLAQTQVHYANLEKEKANIAKHAERIATYPEQFFSLRTLMCTFRKRLMVRLKNG